MNSFENANRTSHTTERVPQNAGKNFMKCSRCRNDHKPCEPRERVWDCTESCDEDCQDHHREKCSRCDGLGHTCGPSTSIDRRRGRKDQPIVKTSLNVLSSSLRPPGNPMDQQYLPAQREPDCNSLSPPRPGRPAIPWFSASSIDMFDMMALILAIRLILLRCQLDFQHLNKKAELSPDLACFSRFQAVHLILQREFSKMFESAKSQLSNQDNRRTVLSVWSITRQVIDLQQNVVDMSYQAGCLDKIVFKPITDVLSDNHQVLECVRNVLVGWPSHGRRAESLRLPLEPQKYQSTAEKIAIYLQKLCNDNPTHELFSSQDVIGVRMHKLSNGFPASHIAFWNGDTTSAVELSRDAHGCHQRTDPFGQSLPHIVIQANDIDALIRVAQTYPENHAIRSVKADDRGYSLLATSALLGNSDAFTICVKRKADSSPLVITTGQTILDLAVLSGDFATVEQIVEAQIVRPPYTSAMNKALRSRREDIARCFLPWLDVCNSNHDLHNMAQTARIYDLTNLGQEIMSLISPLAMHQELQTDLEELDYVNSYLHLTDSQEPLLDSSVPVQEFEGFQAFMTPDVYGEETAEGMRTNQALGGSLESLHQNHTSTGYSYFPPNLCFNPDFSFQPP